MRGAVRNMLKSDFGQWLKSVFRHWIVLLGCAAIAAFQLIYGIWNQSWPPVVTWLILLVCLLVAVFLSWRDEHKRAFDLEERIRPQMQISGGRSVDKCCIWGGETFYFRARLESLGVEPIHKVEAHITEIRKDGEPVELFEVAQLMMHPGCPTLLLLKHKVTGFIDVIKTDLNTQPVLALAWNYASVDADMVASGHTYQIDIAVSAETVPTQACTFVFTWNGNPFTSQFEMLNTAESAS
jgi:hypothetical protein